MSILILVFIWTNIAPKTSLLWQQLAALFFKLNTNVAYEICK